MIQEMNAMHARTHRARTAGLLTAAFALAGFAGAALGQAAVGGSFDEPMVATKPQPQSGSRSSVVMKTIDGENSYELTITDGEVSAKINGKSVPKDRIRRTDDKVELLNKEGKVVHTFHVSRTGAGVRLGEGGAVFRERPFGQFRFLEPGEIPQPPVPPVFEQPKVMLGINMTEAGEDVQDELDLEPGQGILIERVIEGLPAEKAGLLKGDVVVEIDGKQPATPETLRECLREKSPGDRLNVRVVRKDGDKAVEKNLRIQLEKYDAGKLGVEVFAMPFEGGDVAREWGEAARKAQEEAEKAFREAMKMRGDRDRMILGVRPEQFQWFSTPQGDERFDRRITELNQRMEKLDERMANLDKRLSKLADAIEKMLTRDPQ